MKLQPNPNIPNAQPELLRLLRDINKQVNAITEGQNHAFHGAMASVPTTTEHAIGDFVLNSAPVEAGTAGSKYLVHGWRFTATGWLPLNILTGN